MLKLTIITRKKLYNTCKIYINPSWLLIMDKNKYINLLILYICKRLTYMKA